MAAKGPTTAPRPAEAPIYLKRLIRPPFHMATTVAVTLQKPPRRGTRRQFMGISWHTERPPVGVQVRHTFQEMPSCGKLVGGDVIMRVCDEPVSTPEDVVFHWTRVRPGATAVFHVQRHQTHRLLLSRVALRALGLTWSSAETHGALPVVGGTNATAAWLRALQTPGAPQPGDLLVAVDGMAVATREEADALLQRAVEAEAHADASAEEEQPDAGAVALSVLRGWPQPLVGEAGQECSCCPWLSTVTRVPKPSVTRARAADGGGRAMRMAELAPALLTSEVPVAVEPDRERGATEPEETPEIDA